MPTRGTVVPSQYANTAEIGDRPGWFLLGSSQPMVTLTNLPGELDGPWIDLSSVSANQGVERQFNPILFAGNRFLEMTGVLTFTNKQAALTQNSNMLRMSSGPSAANPSLSLTTRLNGSTGINDSLQIARRSSTALDHFDTGLKVETGGILYVVLRMQAESAVGAGDGQAECWINGDQVYSETGITWSTSALATFDNICYQGVRSAPGTGLAVRDIRCWDSFTSGFGVMPEFRHNVDMTGNNVLAVNYTNEGGAPTLLDAISDDDDLTYLETATPNQFMSIDHNFPASLGPNTIREVQTRMRVSKGDIQANTMKVEIRQGTLVRNTFLEPINVVGPAKELIEPAGTLTKATALQDMTTHIANGT